MTIMSKSKVDTVSSGHGLLEGPLWHPRLGLLVADAAVGGVWAVSEGGKPTLQVANRRGIGGMALHESGGVVISGRNVAYKRLMGDPKADETLVLLPNDPDHGVIGFNDLTTDGAGRIYVGSLGFKAMDGGLPGGRTAFLHLVDLDGSTRIVAHDVELTNGLGWSPDGKRLYHSDSLRHIVKAYSVRDDGSLSEPTVFASTPAGHPDGLAVAEDGTVWVAIAHASTVCQFDTDGHELQRIDFPVPMVTSLCFGGQDLRDLYVVSGSTGAPAELGACVFRVRSDVSGLPRAPARVHLPESP